MNEAETQADSAGEAPSLEPASVPVPTPPVGLRQAEVPVAESTPVPVPPEKVAAPQSTPESASASELTGVASKAQPPLEVSADTKVLAGEMAGEASPPLKATAGEAAETTPAKLFQAKELWVRFMDKVLLRKKQRLEKIVQLAEKHRSITNNDVQKLLRVSDATATRYLKELAKEGRLTQMGTRAGTVYEFVR